MSEAVRVERRGHVLEVTLDRPKVNAIDVTASRLLGQAFVTLRDDPDLRVGIVTAAGDRIFSAGWDIKAAHAGSEVGKWWDIDYGPGKFAGLTELWDLNKPVIAALNGHVLGGGLELALACDIRIAADDAQLGLTEINLAIIPGGGGTQRLPRLVGRGKALEMILTGMRVPAAEALRIGLVERVVPAAELSTAAVTFARSVAAKAPIALRYAKEAVVGGMALPLADGIRLEADLSTLLRTTEDRLEGARAFLEKRKPSWSGR